MCVAAKGVVHLSAGSWPRAQCQKMAEDERSVNSPVRPRPSIVGLDSIEPRELLPGRRPNAVVAYGGRARLGFDTASKGTVKYSDLGVGLLDYRNNPL
jgi:hypothetical protein